MAQTGWHGEYGNRRLATLPYPVYVTNSKHWSLGVRGTRNSCERPKARGMAKSPAIARRFAVVRWKLGRQVSLLQLKNKPGTIYGRLRGHCH